jgi:hypothetical protein
MPRKHFVDIIIRNKWGEQFKQLNTSCNREGHGLIPPGKSAYLQRKSANPHFLFTTYALPITCAE